MNQTRGQPAAQRRRRRVPNTNVMGPNAKASKAAEPEETQRRRVERRRGVGVPTPTRRSTRRLRGNPTPTCRKTWKQRESSANMSKDTEAEGTQRRHVEREGGEREVPGNPMRNEGPATTTGYSSSAAWRCFGYILFHFTLFHVPTYQAKEGNHSLVTIYLFTTIQVQCPACE